MAEQNLADSLRHRNNLQALTERAYANALTADHLGTFQGYAHRDIAVNKEWNNPYNYQALRSVEDPPGGHPPEEQLA